MHEGIDTLLIENDPLDLELTLHELRTNYLANRLHVAHDGDETLAFLLGGRADDIAIRLGLVLLDIGLPKANGLDVLRAIRSNESTQQVSVVVLTSSQEERALIETYKLGVKAYLRKPVGFDEFCQTMRRIGLFWLARISH